jgi:hypothetical protein
MFRRLVTENWQASLALVLFVLAALGCLLQWLWALHLPRDQADRRAAMALDDDRPAASSSPVSPPREG